MAFVYVNNTVRAFAAYADVVNMDQRLFESNEGLTSSVIDGFLVRSTERILTQIRLTDWWRELYIHCFPNANFQGDVNLPAVDANLILKRHNDFTDLCVQYALWQYILPRIADFSKEDNAERAKIGFYQARYNSLFDEIIRAGDWYDINDDSTVERVERLEGNQVIKRIR
jgi:hypothetical protein